MRAVRRQGTGPEEDLARELRRLGLELERDVGIEGLGRRRADFVDRVGHVAVFVDGCFWHGCPTHASWPRSNADWWRAKIITNQRRDSETDDRLLAAGWRPMRVWSHEPAADAAQRIANATRDRRGSPPPASRPDEELPSGEATG
jgi:DNA mismatch endonuclease (patch repair protein)